MKHGSIYLRLAPLLTLPFAVQFIVIVLLASLTPSNQNAVASILISGIVASLAVVGICYYFYASRVRAPLAQIADTGNSISGNQQDLPALEKAAEFASLSKLLHEAFSAAKEASGKERALIDNASALICSMNAEGKFETVNAYSAEILGIQSSQLEGRSLEELVIDEDRKSARDCIKSSFESHKIFELRLIRDDREIVWTRWSVFCVQSELRLFCVVQDISEEKRVESLRQEFAQIISDDLQNPLKSLQNLLAEAISEANHLANSDVSEELAMIQKAVDRLLSLVDDLSGMRTLGSKMLLYKTEHNLSEILQESTQMIKSLAQAKKIAVSLPEGTWRVSCDRARMIQTIINLLSNAIKFSPEESKIEITVTPANGNLEICISDSGPGISKELQESLFEPFTQVSTRQQGGFGLGLAICKMIVEAHGGTIGVRSNAAASSSPPQSNAQATPTGSQFWIRLPATSLKDESTI